jgi:glycolate oxidase FAD binding subunit
VGAARDFALGVRFVDGSGTILKNGGRVMKNVTGYDLVKLMCGSWGTLGVLSEISLKVLPMPEAEATLQIGGLDVAGAVSLLARALGSPFDVSGAAFDPALGCAYVRIEGFAPSVRYRAEELRNVLKSDVDIIEGAASAELWRGVRDVVPLQDMAGDIWRVSVKPSDAPVVIAQAQAAGALLDWAGGLIWLALPAGADMRARLQGLAGHATLVRAAPETLAEFGKFEPEAPGLAALSAGLRAKFDPRGILNPNLMTRAAAA